MEAQAALLAVDPLESQEEADHSLSSPRQTRLFEVIKRAVKPNSGRRMSYGRKFELFRAMVGADWCIDGCCRVSSRQNNMAIR